MSSPIIVNDRAFLTTACEGPTNLYRRGWITGLLLLLVVAYAISSLRALLGPVSSRSIRDPRPTSWIAWGDQLLLLCASTGLVSLTLLMACEARWADSILETLRGLLPPERMGGVIRWHTGSHAAIWLITGCLAAFTASIAVAWVPRISRLRVFGAAVIVLACGLLVGLTPQVENEGSVDLYKRAPFVVPALLVSAWSILGFVSHRNSYTCSLSAASSSRCVSAITATLCSGLIFLPANFGDTRNEIQRIVICIDLETGATLWEHVAFVTQAEKKHVMNSYATPTPCSDGKHVVASFGVGVVCLDFAGREIWRHSDDRYMDHSRYGAASSPILVKDTVLVLQDRERSKDPTDTEEPPPGWLTCFEVATGRKVWSVERPVGDAYASPVLAQGTQGTLVLASRSRSLDAHCAVTGEPRWSLATDISQPVASPGGEDGVYCITGGCLGRETQVFRAADTVELLWRTERGAAATASPVIYEGRVYILQNLGVLTCFDVRSGRTLWVKRLSSGRYHSSLVAGDGKLYASSDRGVTTVIAASDEYSVVSENTLGESIDATPAIGDGCILIRTSRHLVRIDGKRPAL